MPETASSLISASDMTVNVTVQTRVQTAPADAFHVIAPIDLALVFTGWGPFPAVHGVRNQTGEWNHVGASRNPALSDGSTATEGLTEYTVGHSFAYEVSHFTNALRWLIDGVRGEWTFTPNGHGTLIRWNYEFKPRDGRTALIRRVLAPLWRRYMQAAVDTAGHIVEQRVARSGH